MTVAVIGAHGGIGRRLLSRLVDAGHEALGIIRSEDQFGAVRDRGAEPRLGDLEGDFVSALDGADAVVFTAGAGGSTGRSRAPGHRPYTRSGSGREGDSVSPSRLCSPGEWGD